MGSMLYKMRSQGGHTPFFHQRTQWEEGLHQRLATHPDLRLPVSRMWDRGKFLWLVSHLVLCDTSLKELSWMYNTVLCTGPSLSGSGGRMWIPSIEAICPSCLHHIINPSDLGLCKCHGCILILKKPPMAKRPIIKLSLVKVFLFLATWKEKLNRMSSVRHEKLNQQRKKTLQKANYPFSHCDKPILKPRVSRKVKVLVKFLINYKG